MKEKTEKKKFRVGAAIFRAFLIIIAGLTVGLAVFSFNANRIGGNQLPMPFGYGASVVLSGSMEPALSVNDFVIVKAESDYAEGDVVVYQSGHELIIHRVVRKDGETFVTRGDANNADDEPISLSDIKGVMLFKIPFIGLIFKYLKTLPGTLIVLGLAIFLLYRSRRREKEKDSEQLDEIVQEIRRLQALQQNVSVGNDALPAVGNDAHIVLTEEPQSKENDAPAVVGNDAHIVPTEEPQSVENDADIVPSETENRLVSQENRATEEKSQNDDFSDLDALIDEIESENK